MSGQYFHITFQWKGEPAVDVVEDAFLVPIDDWFRINPFSWVLYTELSAKEVQQLLRERFPKLTFVIFAIDVRNRSGWMARSFWDWVKKPR